jgi:transposase
MSPEYVRPYVKAHKNNDRDAEAIAEAATRPTMRFVELKTAEQLDMQSLHRVRDRLVGERTALINQLRAVLVEGGITAPQGRRKLELAVATLLDEAVNGLPLSQRVMTLIGELREEWADLDRRIEKLDQEFASNTKANEPARRLATIPGIGVLNATAMAAAVGDAATFRRGRDLLVTLNVPEAGRYSSGRPALETFNPGRSYEPPFLLDLSQSRRGCEAQPVAERSGRFGRPTVDAIRHRCPTGTPFPMNFGKSMR